jgi:hypothetical protein
MAGLRLATAGIYTGCDPEYLMARPVSRGWAVAGLTIQPTIPWAENAGNKRASLP